MFSKAVTHIIILLSPTTGDQGEKGPRGVTGRQNGLELKRANRWKMRISFLGHSVVL